jgi:hypothetical protein
VSAASTRPEACWAALAQALAVTGLPAPVRNEGLDRGLQAVTGAAGPVKAWLNVVDGDVDTIAEVMGGGGAHGERDMMIPARLELIVQARDPDRRDSAFDIMLAAIGAALRADRTLGGACDDLAFGKVQRTGLALDGMAGIKAAEINIEMLAVAEDELSLD